MNSRRHYGTLVPMGTVVPAGTHQNLKILGTAGYRVPRKFQKFGTAGSRVPRKFQKLGTARYRVRRKFQKMGTAGYRIPRKIFGADGNRLLVIILIKTNLLSFFNRTTNYGLESHFIFSINFGAIINEELDNLEISTSAGPVKGRVSQLETNLIS